MGAVCYTPKPQTISKDEVLRALMDKHLKMSITEPETFKTLKTNENQREVLSFSNICASTLNIETLYEQIQKTPSAAGVNTSPLSNKGQPTGFRNGSAVKKQNNINPVLTTFGQIELNILTYFGSKDEIYETLTQMSRQSLYFMKKNYKQIENNILLKNQNERIRFYQSRSIDDEHQSGINQILKISNKELVTVSDDCYLKFWSYNPHMKVEESLASETITCIALTGNQKQRDILVAGCHSGNLLLISASQRIKKDQINAAHYNLIRVIVSLEALKHRYYVTADVCGIIKVWQSTFKSGNAIMEIDLEGAIAYNSMIELMDMLPKRSTYEDTALIACALKSQKIHLILLIPGSQTHQIIKTLNTQQKPTCLIQLSSKHIAVAVGSLKEESNIEIHDINKSKIVSTLRYHNNMIDSLLKINITTKKSNNKFSEDITHTTNSQEKQSYVTWLLSASRDRQIVLWKLIDGKIMRRNHENLVKSMQRQAGSGDNTKTSGVYRMNAEDYRQRFQAIGSASNNDLGSGASPNERKSKKRSYEKQKIIESQEENQDDEDLDDVKNEQDVSSSQNNEIQGEDPDEEEKLIDQSKSRGSPSRKQRSQKRAAEDSTLQEKSAVIKSERSARNNGSGRLIDYYYVIDTGHKDFIRSMVQMNDNTLITASEDKTIKIFSIFQ